MVEDREILAIDSEWGYRDGRVDQESCWQPVVFCAIGLRTGQRWQFSGDDERLGDFIRQHGDDLFVCHNAVAEMKYLLRLGIPLPRRFFDTYSAFRCQTNAPKPVRAGLPHALAYFQLPYWEPAEKKALQQKILHLQFDASSAAEFKQIVDYCFADCAGCLQLYQHLNSERHRAVMEHWIEYEKAIARMELRGIAFDAAFHQQVQEKRNIIRNTLTDEINQTWPIYREGKFCTNAFLQWCESVEITWPKKFSKDRKVWFYSMDRDAFKEMETRHPFIQQLRQVRKTLDGLSKRSLTVDRSTGRNYFSTNIFRTVTSRNQPLGFVFSGPKWERYQIVAESGNHVLVYIDYVAQEIGLAAALSSDANLRAIYESEDCHMDFAIRAGGAPPGATKSTHATARKLFKSVNLGSQYGQTAYGIARKLNITEAAAEVLVSEHRRLFPQFWRWSEDMVEGSFERGWIVTPCGWRSYVPHDSKPRTWQNWPMQAAGADLMRLTIIYLDQQNVQLLAPVHDGFLLTCRRSELDDLREAVNVACEAAIDHVVPGFPLRWDFTVYEERFADPDGLPLWTRLQALLGKLD